MSTLRDAARRLRRHPWHTLVTVVCLALGIGANTAVFSVVNALLLRPLPLPDEDRLVYVYTTHGGGRDPYEASLLDYTTLKARARSLAGVGIAAPQSLHLTDGDRPERVASAAVSADYLATLGVTPVIGRGFVARDDRPGAPGVALVGYGLWQRRFGGDPGIVGRVLRLQGRTVTVVGVLPAGFDVPLQSEMWMPLAVDPEAATLDERLAGNYLMVARLAPGVGLERARSEARVLGRDLERAYAQRRTGWGVELAPLRHQLLSDVAGYVRPGLVLLLGVVGLLLLLACANVAALLLARALERAQDVALQVALGAGRARLARDLTAESLLLSLAGGALGLLLAAAVVPPLMALSPVQANALAAQLTDVRLDARVLAFTFVASLGTSALFGLSPLWFASHEARLGDRLRAGRRATGETRVRRLFTTLTAAEIVLAATLLVSAGLTLRSLRALSQVETGFDSAGRAALELELDPGSYPDARRRLAFAEELLARVRALPGVDAAGLTCNVPLSTPSWDATFVVEGRVEDPSDVPLTAHRVVTPGYLEALGVRLLRGRLPSAHDTSGALPVVVVSRAFAERAWPGPDPPGQALGRRVRVRREPDRWVSVVGVVDDVKEDRYNFRIDRPVWYLPLAQRDDGLPLHLVARARGLAAEALLPALRGAVEAIDLRQPIVRAYTLAGQLDDFLGPQRCVALLCGAFAGVGLLLAAVGTYGVTACGVAQRTTEFGLRLALGARPGQLVRMVLRHHLRAALAAAALGAAGGVLIGRALASTLYHVRPADPATLGGVVTILLAVTLLATWLPTRRVAHADPSLALRYE